MDTNQQPDPRLRQIFDQAMEKPETQRLAFLDQACAGDSNLFQQAVRLIVANKDAGAFLAREEVRPSTIGRYQVTGELGRGAMGVVYEAKDPLIGRSIAVKTIRVTESSRPEEAKFLQQQLFKEATAAGQLSHPNIVTVHDVGMEGNVAFIAMEKVEGASLLDSLGPDARLAPPDVIAILHQCAQALDYAHQKGIVHRDIKPANIMLCKGSQVKIADFGIAKNTLSAQQTGFGVAMGTPSYMSPEQIRMEKLDGRSDQFSLAVVAYELLTGVKPFRSDSLPNLFAAICDGPRPSAQGDNLQLPPAVDGVLQRGLSRRAADRYPDCSKFVSALEAACLTPAAVPPPVKAPVNRGRLLATVGGLLGLAAAGAGAFYWQFVRVAPRQASSETATTFPKKQAAPSVMLFSSTPGSPSLGKAAELRWDVRDATEVAIDPGLGSVGVSGSAEVSPSAPTTYQLTATGPGGKVTATAFVGVFDQSKPSAMTAPPRVVLFEAQPPLVKKGDKFQLRWKVEGVSDLSIDSGVGKVNGDHFDLVADATRTYILTARGQSGTVTGQATVRVEVPQTVTGNKPEPTPPSPPAPPDRAQLFDEAVALRNSGRPEQAAPLFKQSAELGEVRAMFALAESLRANREYDQAFVWYRKAAEAGNVSAKLYLGTMSIQGQGTPKDDDQAAKWFKQAADAGNVAAMDALGLLYVSGRGVPKDLPEAVRWYRKAAEKGNITAMKHAANAYENGLGVSRDLNEAKRFYHAAASRGDRESVARLSAIESASGALPTPPVGTPPPSPVSQQPPPPPPGPRADGGINVIGNRPWTDAGLNVNPGDNIKLLASGGISVSDNGRAVRISPEGLPSGSCTQVPAPQLPCWALIGRIGNGGAIFKVGNGIMLRPRSTGRLLLGVNGSDLGNNGGAWSVTATVERGNADGAAPKIPPPPRAALDPIGLVGIDPPTLSEKGTHKYTLRGSGFTNQTILRLVLPAPAFLGSQAKVADSRPAEIAPDGTWMTIFISIGQQPDKAMVRIQAKTPTSGVASLDVPIKR